MTRASGPLRAVTEADRPAPKSITQAAESGTQRELLVAMRTRIAKTVDDPKCPPRDLAALTRRLHDIDRDIRALDAESDGDDIGEAASTPDEEWSAR